MLTPFHSYKIAIGILEDAFPDGIPRRGKLGAAPDPVAKRGRPAE